MPDGKRPPLERALLVAPLAAAAAVYVPVLHAYFVQDDFLNFYNIRNYGLVRFLLTPHGGHSLVTRNFIWWALYELAGLRPPVFFATALITHVAIVGLLFATVRRLTGSPGAACLSATLWGIAPAQDGALAWYAVYGHVFATAILVWLVYRLSTLGPDARFGAGAALRWMGLVLAAVTSFGVGLGIAVALPAVALLLLPPSRARTRVLATLGIMAVAGPTVYAGLVRLFAHVYGMPIELLLVYGGPNHPVAVLQLFGLLVARGVIDLVAGVHARSIDVATPAGIALVGAYAVAVLLAAALGSRHDRRVVLAGLALALGCYAPIAAGRAVFFRQGIHFEEAERFQYAGMLGLAVVTGVALARLGAHGRLGPAIARPAVLVGAGALALARLRFGTPIDAHASSRAEVANTIAAIRTQIAATAPGEDVYIENRQFVSVGPVMRWRMDFFPGWAAIFVIFFPDNVVDGRRVYFVTEEDAALAGRAGQRTATLLLTPEERAVRERRL